MHIARRRRRYRVASGPGRCWSRGAWAQVGESLGLDDIDSADAGADVGTALALHDCDAIDARADAGAALALRR